MTGLDVTAGNNGKTAKEAETVGTKVRTAKEVETADDIAKNAKETVNAADHGNILADEIIVAANANTIADMIVATGEIVIGATTPSITTAITGDITIHTAGITPITEAILASISSLDHLAIPRTVGPAPLIASIVRGIGHIMTTKRVRIVNVLPSKPIIMTTPRLSV